jgi:HK97 family phage major capsid protein
MTPSIVKALFEKRMQTINNIQALAAVADGREYTADEKKSEERMSNELASLDEKIAKGIDEIEREQRSADALERYSRLTKGQADPAPAGDHSLQVATDLRAFLNGEKRSFEYSIDPRVREHYSLEKRAWNPDVWERRDLLESTSNMPLPTSFSGVLYEVLTDRVGVLRAKQGNETLFITKSGENMVVPKMTDGTAGLIDEGASIETGSGDPTPNSVTLGSFKIAQVVQASRELVEDEGFDVVSYVARQAARAIGQKAGAYYVTGTGSGEPEGVMTNITVGVTGPTGTSTTLGDQATAGEGSDLLVDLLYSVAEPYADNGAWLMRRASVGKIARLKGTNGEVIWQPGLAPGAPDTLLGFPIFTDPNVAAMAANALSIAFGDFNGFAVRLVRGIRFERSDDFAFDSDLVTFKAVLRTDSAPLDSTAIKAFKNSAT